MKLVVVISTDLYESTLTPISFVPGLKTIGINLFDPLLIFYYHI